MERVFRVVRKFKEETEKGWKYGVRLTNDNKDSLTLYFDVESQVDSFQIDDSLVVKLVNPQKTLTETVPA